jgi:hypothetical protein
VRIGRRSSARFTRAYAQTAKPIVRLRNADCASSRLLGTPRQRVCFGKSYSRWITPCPRSWVPLSKTNDRGASPQGNSLAAMWGENSNGRAAHLAIQAVLLSGSMSGRGKVLVAFRNVCREILALLTGWVRFLVQRTPSQWHSPKTGRMRREVNRRQRHIMPKYATVPGGRIPTRAALTGLDNLCAPAREVYPVTAANAARLAQPPIG